MRRGGSTDDYKIIGDHTVTVEDVKHQSIEIQFAEIENLNDTLLLVDSHAKTLKEKSMHDKAAARFEDGLKAIKKGITVLNSPGTIDADYRGEVCIILVNLSSETFVIEDGERIAQMVIARHEQATWQEVEVLDDTERGAGGFGHTGKS